MNKQCCFLLVALIAVCAADLHAQQRAAAKTPAVPVPSTTVSASAFADYYYNLQSPNASLKDENAFQIRRVDLGLEHKFSRTVLVYSEIEANSEELSLNSAQLFVKQAYVEVKNILPQMRAVLGLSPTPAVVTSERIWGYRALQKMPLERYGMATEVDNGFALKGKIDPHGVIAYHVMIGNGAGTWRESDKLKKVYASLGVSPGGGLTLEAYGDFMNEGNERYRASFKGLIGLEDKDYALGLEGIYRINHHTLTQWYDQSPYAVALYGWVGASERVRIVYRGDYFDDDQNKTTSGLRTVEATFGLDYLPVPGVHLMPNVVYTTYTNKNSAAPKLDDAVTVRMTAAFTIASVL